jgi:predicted MPP superfamily phosphohydrolase
VIGRVRLKIFKTRKRIFLSVVGAIVLICASLVVWAFLIEPNRLVVHEVDIKLAAWPNEFNNLKIVSVSDLHVGRRFVDDAKLVQIVETINQTQPDLIVLLGDFVSQDRDERVLIEPEIIAGRLKDLKAKYGVFAVLGNHDWWYNGQRVRKSLEAVGIRVLENDAVQIEKDGQSFWLLGVPDYWTRQPLDIRPGLQKITSPGPVIAITHNPDIFPELPSNVGLTLAGHTHGGQVNFPFFGRPIVPSKFGERYAAGLIQENNRQLFVTTGIGTTGMVVRFRVPPEIALLRIAAD